MRIKLQKKKSERRVNGAVQESNNRINGKNT